MRFVYGGMAIAAAAYAAPAAAAWGPLRRALLPASAGQGDPGHVALTFDDGPHPQATPRLLRLLDEAGLRATFFLLGRQAELHPALTRSIADAGHDVGVHGYEHRLLLTSSPRATCDDLARAHAAVSRAAGCTPRWWRPPYGVATTAALVAAHRLQLTPVLWTCWGRDWTRTATPTSIFRTVRRGLSGGGTILLHDSDHAAASGCWEAMLGALPSILAECQERGWQVGPLSHHGLAGTASHGRAVPTAG
ncbi:polysaccharide deacetylase family protein [Micromonospora sp. 067-2]|uniref:polysaccharide deacetylase family protein n=1 Tax=Micromonospora sp. 067-2 TaxID=2789270 RepID=UPI0039790570